MISSNRIFIIVIVSFLSLLTPTISLAENNKYSLDSLEREILHNSSDSYSNFTDTLSKSNIFKTIIELDARCIPILAKAINSDDRSKKTLASFGLAIIGSDKSLQILKKHANESDEEIFFLDYLIALCGRGKPQDLSVVIKILKENRSRFLTNHAAFHLAYLHPQIYKENSNDFEILKNNRKYFKKIMSQKGQLSIFDTPNVENQIISKIIMSGIPRLNERKKFIDKNNNNTWRLKGGIWNLKKGVWYCTKGIKKSEKNFSTAEIERNKLGWINFNTYISSDESRALVDVSLIFDGLNGRGFIYALKKINGKWKISYFSDTWIS